MRSVTLIGKLMAALMIWVVGSSLLAEAHAESHEDKPSFKLESMTILGSKEQVQSLPGSSALIDEKQIRIETATDINQLLKTIPGTYVREEEGWLHSSQRQTDLPNDRLSHQLRVQHRDGVGF